MKESLVLIKKGSPVLLLDREMQIKDIDIISNDNERQTTNASSSTKRRSFTWAIAEVIFLVVCVILAVMILPRRSKSAADKSINEISNAADLVEFRDPSLEREICSAMGISSRSITKKEAQRVVSLNLSHDEESRGEITDLTGLSSFVMLEDLNLAHNRISDVSELGNLSKLKRLHLEGNEISDVEPLASLTIPLKGLEKVTYLSMGENSIEEISSIAGMKDLTHLIICANSITDISVIRNFPNLVYLEIQRNRIRDYRPLKALRKNCTIVTHW